MVSNELKELRDALPYHYGRLISKELENVGAEQVRLVFSGEITDTKIVEPVLKEAMALRDKLKGIQALKEKAATSNS